VVARVTVEEKSRFVAEARGCGRSESDHARAKLVDPVTVVRVPADPLEVRGVGVAAASDSGLSPLAAAVPRGDGPYGCPAPLCLKRGEKGAACPVHGVPMTFKL
jgi:hypothetical protein